MNGPLALLKSTLALASVGYRAFVKLAGPRRGRVMFIAATVGATVLAVYLNLTH